MPLFKKKTLILTLLPLFLFGLAACKKEDNTDRYIDHLLKEYVVFKKGSYWIYRNETTASNDCTYVTRDPNSGVGNGSTLEEIYYTFSGNLFYDIYLWKGSDYSVCAYDFHNPNGNYFRALNSMYTNGTSSAPFPDCILVERLDTLYVNSQFFTNVIHTQSTNLIYDNMHNEAWFVKNIGMIMYRKKSNTFDSTWSILRWHAVQ